MINEGKGISNVVKEETENIYNLFKSNSYSTHNLKLNHVEFQLDFKEINNYNSNLSIYKDRSIVITIGIPVNGKENRIKQVISHELTHLIEVIGLGDKDFPKYWNIKQSIIEFKPITDDGKLISELIYKTLDNEINANVAQTYIYLNGFGMLSKEKYFDKLKEYSEWIYYDTILKFDPNIFKLTIDKDEILELNKILIKNNVKTIKTDDISDWVDFWFKIFNKKSDIYLKKSKIIIDEVLKKYKHWENYSTIPSGSFILDFSNYQQYFKH